MNVKSILSTLLIAFTLHACGQKIDGTLTSTHWSPDSSYFLEVYKQKLSFALPGQGSDHMAIMALRRSTGELVHLVDSNSPYQILHRSFNSVKWEVGQNILSYAPGRYIEWVDEDQLDMELIRAKVSTYLGYEDWTYFKTPEIFGDRYFVVGEFFNDSKHDYTLDLAILLKDSTESIKLLVYEAYNYNHPNEGISQIDLKDDYSWVGNFKLVKAGDPIWSNWVEGKGDAGRRDLDQTPESEITYLPYEALYLHAGESCGGGFIYWENDSWNWRQQE